MIEKTATFTFKSNKIIPIYMPKPTNDIFLDQGIKVASVKESELEIDSDNSDFNLQSEIEAHPDSLYVKCFAIKADETNDNGDYFSREELIKAASTFVGVSVFTNHQNTDVEKSRGKVVHSWWDEEKNGIMIVARIDAEAYPQLARGIKEDYIIGTSMGASRGHDLVSMVDGTKVRVDELQVGDEVFTHSGKTEKVTAICQTQDHSKLYHIKWSGNLSGLALSFEHPVLILPREEVYHTASGGKTYRKNPNRINKEAKPVFVPASEVRAGDYVLELIDNTVQDDGISNDVAYLLGVYAAEGFTSKKDKYVQFCFGTGDKSINKTKELLGKSYSGSITDRICKDRNGHYVTIYNDEFRELCEKYIGCGSHNKRLHDNVKHWSLELQKTFLGAYIDGDGCKVKSRIDKYGHSSGKGSLQISSASIQMLKDVRQICLRIGVPATLSSHERIASRSTVMGQDTQYVEHILYITNSISEKLNKYSHKAFENEKAEKPKFDSFFYDNYLAHRIKDVPVIDNSEPTYYVQIGKMDDENSDHSYILNDIATHNCQVAYSLCSICHNMAETPDQYCSHIKERKTRHIEARKQKCDYHKYGEKDNCPLCDCKKGEKNTYPIDKEAFEYNYGIKFIENSFVVNPACPECGVTEVIDPQAFLAKVAAIQAILPGLLKAAEAHPLTCTDKSCIKIAGQKEISDLNQALDLISSVCTIMLSQKAQIDLEFLSDLVEVMAKLQEATDELTEQGYGQLPSVDENGQPVAEDPSGGTASPLQPAQPAGTAPGGGKIESGSAGSAGTVTAPTAAKKLNLSKLAKNLIKKSHNYLTLKIAFRKKESTTEASKIKRLNINDIAKIPFFKSRKKSSS